MKIKHFLLALIALTGFLTSCDKEFDSPPVKEIPEGNIITMTQLRNLFQGTPHKFTGDTSVYAIVTADETSGNFYKEVYVSDGNAAINVRLLSSGGLYIGDSIRIYLKGTVLDSYNGMLQLDSVDVDKNIIKQATGKSVDPLVTTIDQIDASMQARLIKLNDVEFTASAQGQTYADAINQQSKNLDLTDCNGNTVLVRTSGYSNFAGDVVPAANGELLAIVGQFNNDIQLYIRKPSDVMFTEPLCGGVPPGTYLSKTWEDQDLTSGGWITKLVTGTLNWIVDQFGGENFAKMSNYNGSANEVNETWLISPAMDLSSATNPILSFETAKNYSGPVLEVLVSSDYDGTSDPSVQGTWASPGQYTLSSGSWVWTNSGPVNLSSYVGNSSVYVAFKYTGTASSGSTWELDDVVVAEN